MPIIRAKDANGTWMTVATATSFDNGGESTSEAKLYIDIISPREDANGDKTEIDLTKYKDCNRFIMFYSCRAIQAGTVSSYYTKYIYDSQAPNSNAYWQTQDRTDTYGYGAVLVPYLSSGGMTTVFEQASTTGTSFTPGVNHYDGGELGETMIFTHNGYEMGDKITIIYAM